MIEDRWMKIITQEGTYDINDILSNFIFLEAKASYPNENNESNTFQGVDGELPTVATFAPFNLEVSCGFDGIDENDRNLAELKLRQLFFRRQPYYIITSDNPGLKYRVNNPDVNPDYLDFSAIKFDMTFSCRDGYAETVKETDEYSLSNGNWQFGVDLLADDDIKYKHDTTSFRIYNGSSDTINPLLRHKFKLLINIDAPKGFKIINHTTGNTFQYKKGIKQNQQLILKGVHPILDNQRVGIDTNRQWLTLKEGFNDIEIKGENIGKTTTQWIFPFIFK